MLSIRLDVNGTKVREIHVLNRGPVPTDDLEDTEADDPGGRRVYTWIADDGRSGALTHARRDGIEVLAAEVLDDAAGHIDAPDPVL